MIPTQGHRLYRSGAGCCLAHDFMMTEYTGRGARDLDVPAKFLFTFLFFFHSFIHSFFLSFFFHSFVLSFFLSFFLSSFHSIFLSSFLFYSVLLLSLFCSGVAFLFLFLAFFFFFCILLCIGYFSFRRFFIYFFVFVCVFLALNCLFLRRAKQSFIVHNLKYEVSLLTRNPRKDFLSPGLDCVLSRYSSPE